VVGDSPLQRTRLPGSDTRAPNISGRCHESDGDQVRAHFSDGSHADGDLLVGADGSNSRVRRQRLPDLRRQDLGIVTIAGRVPLAATTLPPPFTDGGINNVVPAGRGWMFLSTWSTDADRYVVWAWATRETALEGIDLRQHVLDRIQGWAAPLRDMVEATDPSTIATVPLRTMPPLPIWTPDRVTLLGDAVHNMTPMAGIGANTALRDADELRRATILESDPIQAVGAYETVMRAYAGKALRLSTRNARNAALATPFDRAVFRTLLRAGARLPALRRAMFGPQR
jgi:2-polyprenyl-6-methoxyphenol hydroxylase-like FAD-dependent oxidoreductase